MELKNWKLYEEAAIVVDCEEYEELDKVTENSPIILVDLFEG